MLLTVIDNYQKIIAIIKKKKKITMIIGARSKLDCYMITIGENHFS